MGIVARFFRIVGMAALLLVGGVVQGADAGPPIRQVIHLNQLESPVGMSIEERIVRVVQADGHLLNIFSISTVTLAPGRFTFEIKTQDGGLSVQELTIRHVEKPASPDASSVNDFVIINGSFLRDFSTLAPSGYAKVSGNVVSNGVELRRDPILSGTVCSRESEMMIGEVPLEFSAEELDAEFASYPDCLQAGPLLVSEGKVVVDDANLDEDVRRFASEQYTRSFVLRTAADEVVFGVTSPASLFDLVAILTAPKEANGLSAAFALGLQGSSSAAIQIYASGRPFYSRGGLVSPQSSAIVAQRIAD